jgi:hypothetical protein
LYGRLLEVIKQQWTDQLEQALLKVVIVLARITHKLCNGALALAQLAEVEGAQLVQLPAYQCRQPGQNIS